VKFESSILKLQRWQLHYSSTTKWQSYSCWVDINQNHLFVYKNLKRTQPQEIC